MRKVLPAISLIGLALAACGAPMRWEKLGVDNAMTQQDIAACRVAARNEAMRTYYPFPYYGPYFGPRHWLYWQQRADFDRFVTENNLTNFCMRNKGYELVPVPQPAKGPEK